MFAGTLPRRVTSRKRANGSLFRDGFTVMWERLPVYLTLAAICGLAGMYRIPLADIERDPGGAFLRLPALRVMLGLALVALYFIWPSALRRVDSSFRMNLARVAMATMTLLCVGVATEIGYAAAVIPGVVLGVLLSQSLVGALLRTGNVVAPRALVRALTASVKGSFAMTRAHFGSTFGVVALSLLILLVPCAIAIAALEGSYIAEPRSLLATAPLLFLTFTYFECVRYVMIVRWYRRLETDLPQAA